MPESQGSAAFPVVEERKGSGNFDKIHVRFQARKVTQKGLHQLFSSDPWQPGTQGPFFSVHQVETGESLGLALQ